MHRSLGFAVAVALAMASQPRALSQEPSTAAGFHHVHLNSTNPASAIDKKAGVKILEDVHPFGTGGKPAAMIEGPDSIAIELVER
jgi:hypothetical protein